MKKALSLILTLVLVLTIYNTCFAALSDTVDTDTASVLVRNVDTATYDEEEIKKNTGDGEEDPGSIPGTIEIEDQEIPGGLPDTGGIPAEAFYAAGGIFVIAALALSMRRKNAGQ